jgi:hypothetical protein
MSSDVAVAAEAVQHPSRRRDPETDVVDVHQRLLVRS